MTATRAVGMKNNAAINPPIQVDQRQISEFCQRNYVEKLSRFGSVLQEDYAPESDIDVLVAFEPGKTPGFAIIRMEQELSAIFKGRKVDLRTPQELSRYFRDRNLSKAQVMYINQEHCDDTKS